MIRRLRSMAELAAQADGPVRHVHSSGPETICLPPLTTGAAFFAAMQVRELPLAGVWRADAYTSCAPALFTVQDAVVRSSAGVLSIDRPEGGFVCQDTLIHTDPGRHGYLRAEDGIVFLPGAIEPIEGVALSLLSGSSENLFHFLLDGIARLGAVPRNYLDAANLLLVPAPAADRYPDLLGRLALPKGLRLRPVRDGETLRVRTLIQPAEICTGLKYHPCLVPVTRALAVPRRRELPRRFYVDRRRSAARPLVNEDELVAALARLGVPAIALEERPVAEQMALFSGAELVVAPHGAGLAHLAYAPPGCRVLELLMDSYAQYGFRTLAAVCGLAYDCVIGRSLVPWPEVLAAELHASPWQVSVPHAVAAVAHFMAQP